MRPLKLFFIVCFIMAATFAASAQATKMPTTQADIQKMVTVRPVTRAIVLPDTEKIKIVQTALKGKIPLTKTYSLTQPIKLDPRNSFVDGKARMYFDWASEVSASDNQVYFDQDGKVAPRVRLFYNAAAPGFYVFDFAIENMTFGKSADLLFRNFFVDSQTKTMDKGAQHQLFITNVKTAGWNLITLESKTGFWKFYSVEISQFK